MRHYKYSGSYGLYADGKLLTPTEKYDQWIDFGVDIKRESNTVEITYGLEKYTVNYDFNSWNKSKNILIQFWAWAWYHDHTLKVDDLSIEYY